MLPGPIFDDREHPMRLTYVSRHGQRYRYYVSAPVISGARADAGSLPRIGVGVIDRFVLERVAPLLSTGWCPEAELDMRVKAALRRVSIGADRVVIVLRAEAAIASALLPEDVIVSGDEVIASSAVRLKHCKGVTLIETPAHRSLRPDRALLRALALSHLWARQLANGEVRSIFALAKERGLCKQYAAKLVPLAWLAPDLTAAILAGEQPRTMSLGRLIAQPLPLDWDAQRRLFATMN